MIIKIIDKSSSDIGSVYSIYDIHPKSLFSWYEGSVGVN